MTSRIRIGRSRARVKQDADPNNATDCDTAGPPASRFARAGELQAFDDPSTVVDVPAP